MVELDAFQQTFKNLLTEFASSLPRYMRDIDAAWEEARCSGWQAESVERTAWLAHKLAGTGGMLGYELVHLKARSLEGDLRALAGGYQSATPAFVEQLASRLEMLRQAALTDHPRLEPENDEPSVHSAQREARSERLVHLLADDLSQARELARQVSYFGYSVSAFTTCADLCEAMNDEMPSVLVVDTLLPAGRYDDVQILNDLYRGKAPLPPIIYLSPCDTLEARLQAVRSGGAAFFIRPVNIGSLVDALDRITNQDPLEHYRVLIVEDSATTARVIARYLQKGGMETHIAASAPQVIEALVDFDPELVLLDLTMPDVSGQEMARVIRQNPRYDSLPIVFLSAEQDRMKQLDSLALGGDDFLTKPINEVHLVAAVTSRIERYRKLRRLMLRDGLTGLLNHSMTKERLSQETSRAERTHRPLSFAMLDLDHFKSINDTYGHPAGDQVIKSLARLVSQRVRRSDIVGRYGGEEFAVILPETGVDAACSLMNELRAAFSRVVHRAGEKQFQATFSCGVADVSRFPTADALNDAADRALYAAKRGGRNRVMAAEDES